jgi:hypothetical protein
MPTGSAISSCRPHTASSRGAFLFPIEKQRWLLSVGGNHGDAPPGDRAGFMDFVRSLRTPTIYDAVRDARPLTDIVRYKLPCSTRRHFERLASFPAVCSSQATRFAALIRSSARA